MEKATKIEPGVWGYIWAALSVGDINIQNEDFVLQTKLLLGNPKKREPDGLIHDVIF
jgi:hypothetical protein